MAADSPVTLSGISGGRSLREWLETLRVDIDSFLATNPEGRLHVQNDADADFPEHLRASSVSFGN
jgi:hypothetical protein